MSARRGKFSSSNLSYRDHKDRRARDKIWYR